MTIFDPDGNPCAYITMGDMTIYLLEGNPVAYLDGSNVYGFNGKHLGWFETVICMQST